VGVEVIDGGLAGESAVDAAKELMRRVLAKIVGTRFDYNGNIRAKNIQSPPGTRPAEGGPQPFNRNARYRDPRTGKDMGNPHRGTLIDPNATPEGMQSWADDVHFDAPGPVSAWSEGVEETMRSRLNLVIPGKGQSVRIAEKAQ
jgi:hypothetical protein